MLCKQCGAENAEDSLFCASCGASLAEADVKQEAPDEAVEPQANGEKFGPFELRGELGRGAMARVWRAWDPNLGREVAIKEPMFDQNLPADALEEMGKRFVREAKTAANLNHPGIVTIYAADVYDGRPAIVMELVEGATLGDILESSGSLDPATALDALDQLLDAVGYAHKQGVVHRDIKPDNIFVSEDGRVKLADFGIARVDDGAATRATMVGTVLGTPGYMSPEQAKGDAVDARSDLFSIGVVGYEMLSGKNPFGAGDGSDSTTLLYRIVHEPAAELPVAASSGLPADLRPAIMAALAKDPAMRPQNAEAFKNMLHGGSIPVPAAAPSASGLGQAASGAAKGAMPKWLPYAIVAAVCVVVVAVVFVMATSGGGGGAVGGGAVGNTASGVSVGSSAVSASAANSPVYLAVKNGKVAIYTNSSAEPYEVSDVEVADLDDADQERLSDHVGFNTVEEAQVKIGEYEEAIAKAKKEAEEEAAKKKEAEEAAAKAAKTWYVCASDFVTLRVSTDRNSSEIMKITVREPVEYLGSAGGEWSHVRYNGIEGYVLTRYISQDPDAPLDYGQR